MGVTTLLAFQVAVFSREAVQKADLVVLTPTDEPTVVGVEQGLNGIERSDSAVGESDGARACPSKPVACPGHA